MGSVLVMTERRMKSRDIRDNWRDVLDYVRAGNEVIIEHYTKPIARIVPIEENAMTLNGTQAAFHVRWGNVSGTPATYQPILSDLHAHHEADSLDAAKQQASSVVRDLLSHPASDLEREQTLTQIAEMTKVPTGGAWWVFESESWCVAIFAADDLRNLG